jgi:hypothetical protein
MDLAVKRHSVELGHGAHAVRLGRSVTAPLAGGVFQETGGRGEAFGGFGHPGGDLTGSSDALRSDRGDVLVVDCRDAWRCGAILPRSCGWRSTRRAASMPSRRSLPRSWHALTSNTHGSSPATTAASTGTTHQSKSIELVQSQYRAPVSLQFMACF